jgi:transcriptional regulator with XRE-family HTH domain
METRFARWRRALGLTQVETTHLLGVGVRRIHDYESGKDDPPISVQFLMTRIMLDVAEGRPPLPIRAYLYSTSVEFQALEAAATSALDRKTIPPARMPGLQQNLPPAEMPGGARGDGQDCPQQQCPARAGPLNHRSSPASWFGRLFLGA